MSTKIAGFSNAEFYFCLSVNIVAASIATVTWFYVCVGGEINM